LVLSRGESISTSAFSRCVASDCFVVLEPVHVEVISAVLVTVDISLDVAEEFEVVIPVSACRTGLAIVAFSQPETELIDTPEGLAFSSALVSCVFSLLAQLVVRHCCGRLCVM